MTRTQKIILTLVIVVGLFYISPLRQFAGSNNAYFDYEEDKLKFDRKRWIINWDKNQTGENDRHFMLDDLMTNYLKIGMDSLKIKELLGAPERDFGFSYSLGLYRSGFDPTFLILQFDNQGKLKDKKIQTI